MSLVLITLFELSDGPVSITFLMHFCGPLDLYEEMLVKSLKLPLPFKDPPKQKEVDGFGLPFVRLALH